MDNYYFKYLGLKMALEEFNDNFNNRQPGDHIKAHDHCIRNRAEIEASDVCGCFYCLNIFKPIEIDMWWDSPRGTPEFLDNALGTTATCPKCGIDSVIGSASGYPVNTEFLRLMKGYWFGCQAF